MRLLQGQRRGGNRPIIRYLSHSSRTFYAAGGPPVRYADAKVPRPCPLRPASPTYSQGMLAPMPLITFKCPAATFLETSRIASRYLPLPSPPSTPQTPLLLCRWYSAARSHSLLAPRAPKALSRYLKKHNLRAPFSPRDLHATQIPSRALSTMSQPEWTGVKVRNTFFEFFEKKGHTIVPSGSVVPHNDPTLRE